MASMAGRPDWAGRIRRRLQAAGTADLPPHTVAELAEHLDDLYTDAIAHGLEPPAAEARAMRVLDASDFAGLRAPRLRDRPPAPPNALPGLPPPSLLRSFSMSNAIRLAFRQFAHHRSFALVTVLVLGLGIGAAVTVYSIVDGVLLKPLPYSQPDRLVTFWDVNHERGLSHEPISPVNFLDYRDLDVFTDAAGWWRPDVNLTDPGADPVRVRTIETSANLFDVLGVRPALGPGFPTGEGVPYWARQPLLAVISDRLWRTRYDSAPDIVGRQIPLNGAVYEVVGVMPRGFDYPGDIDVWQRSTWDFSQHSRSARFMEAVARMTPGTTVEQARAAVDGLGTQLETQFPQTNRVWRMRLVPLFEEALGYYRPALIVLFGAVGLLLVIGCLNVASLLLTRAISREREVAVRTALGASPRHLVVQLLAESLVLSLAGAATGVLAAFIALPLIVSATPLDIPRLAEVSINGRVLAFAVAVATGTTILFGLVPALVMLRRSLAADVRAGERGSSRASRTLYRTLVTGEVALAMALLVGSALLVRTVSGMTNTPLGITRTSALTASVQLSGQAYTDWNTVATTHGAILEELRRQPGVRAAGSGNFLPLEAGWRIPFAIVGDPLPAQASDLPQVQIHSVSEGFFESLGATLRSGRAFTTHDATGSAPVVIVNETFARQYLQGRTGTQSLMLGVGGIGPLGRNLMPREPVTIGGTASQVGRFEVIGTIADVRNTPLGQSVEPAIYFQSRQFPFRAMFVAIDAVDTATAMTGLRNALKAVAPNVPFADASTWEDRFRTRTAEPRLLMTLLLLFGGLAGVLAALGVYGLFAWTIAMRRRELAIRLTLGARPVLVGGIVLRQATVLIAVGIAVGWLVVQAASGMIGRVLFDISAADVRSLAVAGVVLFAASLLACLPAAIRAMRTDPVDGLRAE
jgi:predicted permease